MEIEVRYIDKNEYDDARRIWEVCFPEDVGAFCDYYFSYRTSPKRIMAAFLSDGTMVADLHMLPYDIRIGGIIKHTAFIAGVGTLPEYRGRGICARLMYEAHREIAYQGSCAAILQPSIHGYYEKLGYRGFVYKSAVRLTSSGASTKREMPFTASARELLEMYNGYACKYDGMMVRDERYYELLLREQNEANAFILSDGAGYAFGYIEDETANVTELIGENTEPLIKEMLASTDAVNLHLPIGSSEAIRLGGTRELFNMMYVIDEEALLSGLSYSDTDSFFADESNRFALEYY